METLYVAMITLGILIMITGVVVGFRVKNKAKQKNEAALYILNEKKPIEMTNNELRQLSKIYMNTYLGLYFSLMDGIFCSVAAWTITGFVLLMIEKV